MMVQITFAQVSNSEVLGTWKLDMDYIEEIFGAAMEQELASITDPEERQAAENQMEMFMPMMMETFAEMRMTFNDDGTFENYSPGFMGSEAEIDAGTWYLDGNTLYTIKDLEDGDSEENQMYISAIDQNSMMIEPLDEQEDNPIKQMRMIRE